MATANNGKGQSKGHASPAALDNVDEFRAWAHDEVKRNEKKIKWFPNSPKSPTGK